MAAKYKPIVLLILDGWGLSPSWGGNAISMNNPPTMNKLWREYPHKVLQAFRAVAGETGKVGNSEIGHISLGSGKVIRQDLDEITLKIRDKSFFKNAVLDNLYNSVLASSSNLHLIGLLSDGNVHSSIEHLFALLDLAKEKRFKTNVFIHVITDGRDVEVTSALHYLDLLEKKIAQIGLGKIASVCGRYYAMDRDNHWDQIELAYRAQVFGQGKKIGSAKAAVSEAYRRGVTDEYIPPYVITENNNPVGLINDGDGVVFFNSRPDRARQLTRAYVDRKVFKSFFRRAIPFKKIKFVTLTSYRLEENLPLEVAFPTEVLSFVLARILSSHGLSQLHLAESEKYGHVTYFFNGGREEPFPAEERVILPSPKVVNYQNTPAMRTPDLAKIIVSAIEKKKHDFIVANFANVDMVGHTGNILAASQAILSVDEAVKNIVEAVIKNNAALMITADHGNAEQMVTVTTGDPETIHTLNPVPFIYVTSDNHKNLIRAAGGTEEILSEIVRSENTLADVAPTILELFGISVPIEMTGKSLLGQMK